MDRELLALLDEDGHVVGAAPRGEVRRRNLRHAATAVLVRDGRGRVYLHRRTPDKDLFPGRYDVWAGGCVRAGEAPAEAARRELDEELGIVGARLAPLFTADYADECTRYRAYAYEVRWDGPVRHQPEEVAEGRWVGLDELRTRLADPAWPFVPDGRALLEHWLAGAGEAERT